MIEAFEYKKKQGLVIYLSQKVIDIIDSGKRRGIRDELFKIFDVNYFSVMKEDRESLVITLRNKEKMQIFEISKSDRSITLKGERRFANSK